MTTAISVENVTKRFRTRHHASLKRALLKPFRPDRDEDFVALDSISFSVPSGQTAAVIGRNGSGKSTMLGILARVYRPNEGSVSLKSPEGNPARVAPLLSLGAGLHPDLTAEQNIAFYGSILGLRPKEVEAKRDAIVEFSELGNKMDTSLHGWNDGAKLRLGFSIAVHIDPDILLVDEVMAVGDEAFQNKCYRLIDDLQKQGKTILFVSHDLAVVEKVADRIIWLHNGRIRQDGDVAETLKAYREDAQLALATA